MSILKEKKGLKFDFKFEGFGKVNKEVSKHIEIEKKEEMGEALQKIKENEKKYKEQLELETDTDFYFQVVFKSKKEMHDFIEKHNIKLHYNDFVFYEDIAKFFESS